MNRMPNWLNDLMTKQKADIAHFFILWGNIYDWQRNTKGDYVSLYQYLAQIFAQRELVMFYSISSGLQFASEEMEKVFREQYLSANVSPPSASSSGSSTRGQPSAVQQARQGLQQTQNSMPLDQVIGKSPERVLPLLERALVDNNESEDEEEQSKETRKVLIIDFAHNLVPAQMASSQNVNDRVNIETLERWARDARIKDNSNLVLLLTPHLAGLADSLHSSQSSAEIIRIPKPREEARTTCWKFLKANNGLVFEEGLTPEMLGRITNGLSLQQIESIYQLAKSQGIPITLELIKSKKQEILQNEFGDRIKVSIPRWGFDYFGGKKNVKEYMLELRDNIIKGINRRVPMGILAAGPPGTGKTFFFECWAYECGFNFVEITNPRIMWVGQSEEMMERIFATLDDLAPVVVIEDEADQSETPRDVPNGDSGVSNRLRQMKFKFCSDPKRRGKVIWVRISNRDDLLDAAYKRKGRTDDNIPFVLPQADEYSAIFEVMFKRYEIPTDIKDFTVFAQKVAKKLYCTGADIEWIVLEADKYTGREGLDKVTKAHLLQAIEDWEMDLNPADLDQQIILAIQGSSKRLRPENWQEIMSAANERLYGKQPSQSAVLPEMMRSKSDVPSKN